MIGLPIYVINYVSAALPPEPITDESGENLLTEASDEMSTE